MKPLAEKPWQFTRRCQTRVSDWLMPLSLLTLAASAAAQQPAPAGSTMTSMAPGQAAPPDGPAAEVSPTPADGPAVASEPSDSPRDPVAPPPALSGKRVVPVKAAERRVSLQPKAAEAGPAGRITFDVDPIADGSIIAVSLGFAAVLDVINSTGEIRPQQISPNFERSSLAAIDRAAVDQTPDPNAATLANLGMFSAVAFAVADPILSGVREGSVQTGLVDVFLYAETMSVTFALTDMVKIAVRRPRPQAYIDAEANRDDPEYSNADTDSTLSFFSLHSSMTASIGATATYLAFARSKNRARPWITLALATGLSTFVSVQRVRAGKHFPTDVIAGTVAGAGVGILVPHLHRTQDVKERPVWVGFAPADGLADARGGSLLLNGAF